MITLYSGTPGSGKSYNASRTIYKRLSGSLKRSDVIANFYVNTDNIKNLKGKFTYVDNSDLTVKYLIDYALSNHELGVEGQTLVVVDECQVIWNAREWQSNGSARMDWIKFFTQHRKLGFDFLVIAQNDRMIDRQIRSLFEYNIVHRKINNFMKLVYFPIPTFVAVTYWYGINEKLQSEFFLYRKKYGSLYDSFGTFELDDTIKNIMKG